MILMIRAVYSGLCASAAALLGVGLATPHFNRLARRAASFLFPREVAPSQDTLADRRRRHDMVREQLIARGVTNPHVLRAMARVPRHLFLSDAQRLEAYSDNALSTGERQTISQPLIVAVMTDSLDVHINHRVLEIGTGTGYQTAILAMLADHVYTIERFASLSNEAHARLAALGLHNVDYRVGDGSQGWPEHACFDRIMVTAAAPGVPEPLLKQLAERGVLVIPTGDRASQMLKRISYEGGRVYEKDVLACRFVPLIGSHGW